MKYIIAPFIKVFDFSGTSNLKEFWLFFLAQHIIFICLGFIGGLISITYLGKIYLYVSIIPFLALGFRRLNDAGFNRWLFLIPLVNLVLAGIKKKKN